MSADPVILNVQEASAPPIRVAAVSGSLQPPSRTRALVDAVVSELIAQRRVELAVVDLAEVGAQIGPLRSRKNLPPEIDRYFAAVEQADVLVVGSPIYKASYSGLFKHFFDLFDPTTLAGLPVILTATGGTERHVLALEHQFRPLFAFFGAATLPTTVFALDRDIQGREVVNADVIDRIRRAVAEAVRIAIPGQRAPAQVQPFRLAATA